MKFAAGTKDSVSGRPYFFVSDCARYTVCLPVHEGEPYIAWLASVRLPEQRRTIPAECLGCFPNSKDAKQACESHAANH